MGHRINKILGYGITNFKGFQFDDEKLEAGHEEFFAWCRAHVLDILMLAHRRLSKVEFTRHSWESYMLDFLSTISDDERRPFSVFDLVVRQGQVLVFCPPGFYDWRHRNDAIDFYEWTLRGRESGSRLQLIPSGLSPFDKDAPPICIAALCLFLGVGKQYSNLNEVLFEYWA